MATAPFCSAGFKGMEAGKTMEAGLALPVLFHSFSHLQHPHLSVGLPKMANNNLKLTAL